MPRVHFLVNADSSGTVDPLVIRGCYSPAQHVCGNDRVARHTAEAKEGELHPLRPHFLQSFRLCGGLLLVCAALEQHLFTGRLFWRNMPRHLEGPEGPSPLRTPILPSRCRQGKHLVAPEAVRADVFCCDAA